MSANYVSLLFATVLSGLCLAATMMGFWLTSRRDSFKLTWSLGVLVLVAHVVAYTAYADNPQPLIGALVVALLPVGLAILHGAAHQFFDGKLSRGVVVASVLSMALAVPPMAFGYDGVAFIVQNFAAASLLVMSGVIFFRHRAQAPAPLGLMVALYWCAAASFAACGLVLLLGWQWQLGGVPDNWAERVNVIVSIIGMTGAGAIFISLDQTRLAQRLRAEAITDPLTGLLNRRGLNDRWGEKGLGAFAAVAVFDLDHFKAVNDAHGHAVGDEVLCRFATILDSAKGRDDLTLRLGGEEFALVMPRITSDRAEAVSRKICTMLSLEQFGSEENRFSCTASAGVAFGDASKPLLDQVLESADRALYAAKNAGRNRVELARLRLVS